MEGKEQEDPSAQNSVKCTLLKGDVLLLSFFLAQVQEDKRTSVIDKYWDKLSKLGRKALDTRRQKTEQHESVPGLLFSLFLFLGKD